MSIPAISCFSNYFQYFNTLTVPLSDDDQSRIYTVVRISIPSIPEEPILPYRPNIDSPSLPNLKEMKAVPEELHNDDLFKKHTDPISFEPIFDPAVDRNEPKHIYERANIIQWLQTNHTSPLTRKPMTEDDLVPVPELKEKINEKINDHLLQKQPELLEKHKEKIEKANIQYQEALNHYYEVKLPQYKSECQNLPSDAKISLIARRSLNNLKISHMPIGLQLLQGRVSVLSSNSSVTSRIQNIVRTNVSINQME